MHEKNRIITIKKTLAKEGEPRERERSSIGGGIRKQEARRNRTVRLDASRNNRIGKDGKRKGNTES